MGDGRLRLSSTTFARVLSTAGHPLLLVPLTVAAATRNWRWTLVIAAGTILPLFAIIVRNVRRGTWSDTDVSRHEQRPGLYLAAVPLLAVSAVVLYLIGAPASMLRPIATAVVMLLIGLVGNRFLKTSMHMMFAAFCGVSIVRVYPWSAIAIVPFVLAIAWSRRKLERHTRAEVAAGLLLGLAAGLYAFGVRWRPATAFQGDGSRPPHSQSGSYALPHSKRTSSSTRSAQPHDTVKPAPPCP